MSDGGQRPRDYMVEVELASKTTKTPRHATLHAPKRVRLRVLSGLPPGGREECRDGPRPCPYVHCKHHLWLVLATDRLGHRLMRPAVSTVEPHSLTTCALDVAERERTARQIGELLGITERRVQQIVKAALDKLRANGVELRSVLEE